MCYYIFFLALAVFISIVVRTTKLKQECHIPNLLFLI